jgi:hypothetical protein
MDYDPAKSHSVQTENISKTESGTPTNGYGHHVAKPSFGTRLKNNLKRFWWLYLIILIAVILVIVLPM